MVDLERRFPTQIFSGLMRTLDTVFSAREVLHLDLTYLDLEKLSRHFFYFVIRTVRKGKTFKVQKI